MHVWGLLERLLSSGKGVAEEHRFPIDKKHSSGVRPRFSKVLKPMADFRHSKTSRSYVLLTRQTAAEQRRSRKCETVVICLGEPRLERYV